MGGKHVSRMEKMMTFMRTYPMSPIQGILKHPLWLTDPDLMYMNASDNEVKKVLNNWTNQLVSWNTNDFHELYESEGCIPIFSAGYGSVETYYYDVEKSVEILDELVMYQCGEDVEAAYDFMNTLFNVLERKVPKLNVICIYSQPSSGKNFFFDAIKDFYINCGHLNNANKYNAFAFQDAESRRLVLWNEPNYSPEFLEPIKKLFGGDSTTVNVKYMSDMPVYRTPIIVLTNSIVSFMTDNAFDDRMKQYSWMPAPYLANYDLKPHPLATYELFKKYNLV